MVSLFSLGEVRLDISYESTRRILPDGPSTEYLELIQEGKEELERLKQLDPDAVVNVKDLRYEQERKAEEDRSRKRAEILSMPEHSEYLITASEPVKNSS